MSDFIKKIRTTSGDKQIDYTALANLPELVTVDSTLTESGKAADAKVVGEKLSKIEQDGDAKYANLLKGHAKGEAVRVDDVSPIEHTTSVFVRSKNYWNSLAVPVSESLGNTSVGVTNATSDAITITSKEGHTGNGYCRLSATLREICPQLKAGKTYILHATSDAINQMIFLEKVQVGWGFNTTSLITEEMLDCAVVLYGLNAMKGQGTGDLTISNIQIEEGDTVTEYTPYVDPSNVTLTRCGKNILGYADDFEITQNGLTIGYDSTTQIFTIHGTPSEANFSINFGGHLFDYFALAIGTDVALSIEHISGTLTAESMTNVFYLGNSDEAEGGRNNWFSVPFPTSGRKTNTSTATRKYFNRTWLYVGSESNVTFTDYKFKVQLEIGNEASAYEEFVGVKYPTNTDGEYEIASLSPTTTLVTDNANVNIDVEYNRDVNVVIDKLTYAIEALGGTV